MSIFSDYNDPTTRNARNAGHAAREAALEASREAAQQTALQTYLAAANADGNNYGFSQYIVSNEREVRQAKDHMLRERPRMVQSIYVLNNDPVVKEKLEKLACKLANFGRYYCVFLNEELDAIG